MIARNGNKQNPEEPEDNGGLGGPAPSYPIQSEKALSRMEGRALRWNVRPEWRDEILERQYKTAVDPASSPRDSARAAKFVLDADRFEADCERPTHQTNIAIQNNGGEVKVVHDENWYGNAHRLPPETS